MTTEGGGGISRGYYLLTDSDNRGGSVSSKQRGHFQRLFLTEGL